MEKQKSRLGIYFCEDIQDILLAIRQSQERVLQLAKDLGADSRDIDLIYAAVTGVLDDVATAFGLGKLGVDFTVILADMAEWTPTQEVSRLELDVTDRSFWL